MYCKVAAIILGIALAVSIAINIHLYCALRQYEEAPAQYVQTYRGWIIVKVKNAFHPPAMHHPWIYVAYKDERVILGVDLPDLIADIDEAEK